MVLDEKYTSLQKSLESLMHQSPKTLILGIGENRMGDDGAGQYISFGLEKYNASENIRIINGGITPEERINEIVAFQPDLMIIIDVIDLPASAGTVKIFEEDQMVNYLPISSHSMPLPVFVDRCRQYIPGITMKLVGIKPFSLEFLDRYALYKEEEYSLDDKEANPNIPFYDFNLTSSMLQICEDLIQMFSAIFDKISIP